MTMPQNPNRRATLVRQLAFAAAVILLFGSRDAAAKSDATLTLEALSNRADLVSGGDVLLRVTLPRGVARGALFVNGQRLVDPFHAAPDGRGYLALATGLNVGRNVITLMAGGRGVELEVTNHPIGGPIFSGPHLQPWGCTTQNAGLGAPVDADCSAPTQYSFFYKSVATGLFVAYDPNNPPASGQIATTTTDQGRTVPYVVRQETGTLNRSIYKIAVLFDRAGSWAPWAPQAAWNGKVVYFFGAGAGTQYTQGTASSSVLNDNALSRGFATASATLTNEGTISNAKLNAETLMMVKERFMEEYGPIRYTVGSGCSGGAIQQHSIGDQYPGLVDGFLPQCSYPDMWSLVVNGHDCMALTRYFTVSSPQLWTNAADRQAVLGLPSERECPGQDGPPAFGARWFPVSNTSCLLPPEALYNPSTNPHGVRCGMKDYHINELGVRPQDGFTYQIFDSVGLQYGVNALLAGAITAEQFVDLNERVGGMDIDGNWQPDRTRADLVGLERMYQSGLITYGRELGKYPIIDARADDNFEMHNNSEWMFTRNRLLRTNGNANNEAHWWESVPANAGIPTAATALKAFNVMDQWLAAIEADKSSLPHSAKVTRNKPPEARDACLVDGQWYDWTAGSICDARFSYTGLTRMVAGGPNTNDVLKCRLKPLRRTDYGVALTDAQWSRLQRVFPDGVCDFSKRGVGQQPPRAPWLSFTSGPGGLPLGPPPRTGTGGDDDDDDR